MKITTFLSLLLLISFPVISSDYADADYDDDDNDDVYPFVVIQSARDFHALSDDAHNHQKIIMLEVTASYCDYCHLLEEEIIKPMLRSGDYDRDVLIRQLEIDGEYPIAGFAGESTTHAEIAQRYHVILTPTLLFLDINGNEVAPRILGVNSLDFYGGFVDDALALGLKRIRSTN